MPEPTPPSTPTKRKRSPIKAPPPLRNFHISNPVLTPPERQPWDTGSPRTKIAYKFVDLQLQTGVDHTGPTESNGSDVIKKRTHIEKEAKITEWTEANAAEYESRHTNGTMNPLPHRRCVQDGGAATTMTSAVEEPSRISPPYLTARLTATHNTCFPARSSTPLDTITLADTAAPRSPPQAPGPSHCRDSDITGHTLDGLDDDGYGINGIGFKPTKAMEAERKMQRRRQISECKAREAAEARKRRAQKRREPPKVVRFA